MNKDLIIPTLNVNDEKVTIEDIRFQNLDFINEGDILYTVSTSKSVEEYEVDFSGYVVLYVNDGDEVAVGKSAGMIFSNKEDAETKMKELNDNQKVEKILNVSKKAISFAESIGFDLSLIKKEGIIKVEDIENYISLNK